MKNKGTGLLCEQRGECCLCFWTCAPFTPPSAPLQGCWRGEEPPGTPGAGRVPPAVPASHPEGKSGWPQPPVPGHKPQQRSGEQTEQQQCQCFAVSCSKVQVGLCWRGFETLFSWIAPSPIPAVSTSCSSGFGSPQSFYFLMIRKKGCLKEKKNWFNAS